jgi:hypothetical protein
MLSVLSHVEKGALHEKNIDNVFEEFLDLAKDDPVMTELIGFNANSATDKFNQSTVNDKRQVFLLLARLINEDAYISATARSLLASLDGTEWREIDSALSRLVTELLDVGYSKGYIYKTLMDFFHGKDKTIKENNYISGLVNLFPLEPKKYNCYILVSIVAKGISKILGDFNAEIVESGEFDKLKITAGKEVLLKFKDVEAMDAVSARSTAVAWVNIIRNIMRLYGHDVDFAYSQRIAVQCGDDIVYIARQKTAMLRGFDTNSKAISQDMISMVEKLNLDSMSIRKFGRAIDYHNSSLGEDDPTRIVANLWFAFESLVPKDYGENIVDGIINALYPYLSLYYIEKHLKYADYLMDKWYGGNYKGVIGEFPLGNRGSHDVLSAILLTDELPDLRKKIAELTKNDPILINRMGILREKFKTPKRIHDSISSHLHRVGLQIRRIYRTRNLLVHLGQAGPDWKMELLAENAHEYFDILVDGILRTGGVSTQSMSIRNCLDYSRIACGVYMTSLKSNDNVHNLMTYESALFPKIKFA